jgi:hypothetical protein
MMDIEKLRITQAMRKEAVILALQHKFKKKVDAYTKNVIVTVQKYALSRKCNKEAIDTYSNLSPEFKTLVRVSSRVCLLNKEGEYVALAITNGMRYLDFGCNEDYLPFCAKNAVSRYHRHVDLPFSYPLLQTDFKFEDKVPASIQKLLDVRKELMGEIDAFAKNTYHALCHVKNIKDIRTYMPAIEQFVPIPEKEFTKIVPYSFFDKVNKSVNN